jgi:hypothetical protein
MRSIILGFFSFFSACALAQFPNKDTYDIVKPKSAKDCDKLFQILRSKPRDVRFQASIKGDSVFFVHNDIEWLKTMISSKKDGIAVDLVAKDQYRCVDPTPFATDALHRGFLLPPVYRDELIKNSRLINEAAVIALVGKIPEGLSGKVLEANLIILEDKNRCYYNNTINIDYHSWGLLQTGLYYDTLTKEKIEGKYKQLAKTLRFVIPFDKDKIEYKAEDIKPLYDSLQITDYAIQSIDISAYTSVEGSFERNMKLQNERAESIVKALQSYQSEKIRSSVSASEDWVEFLEDVSNSIYSYFLTMSKAEVKEKLKSDDLLKKLEPILRKERKAIVELKLEKRLSYQETNKDQLKSFFQQSIAKRNIDEALYLQQIIFFKIRKEELPEQFLNELEVPEAMPYGSLLINHRAFLVDNEYDNVFEAVNAFEKLDALLPNNPKIKYNLCVLKMRAWMQTDLLIDKDMLVKNINALRGFGIPENLVKRLMINYHIFLSELAMQKRDYAAKDRSMQFIYNSYRSLKMNDDDLVNLSKYFCYYSKFEIGEQILIPRSKAIDVSEDLLFYYLNLTIFNEKNTANKFYRITLLNAVNRNTSKFCRMFGGLSEGGITFQLLGNPFLKKSFCENCSN